MSPPSLGRDRPSPPCFDGHKGGAGRGGREGGLPLPREVLGSGPWGQGSVNLGFLEDLTLDLQDGAELWPPNKGPGWGGPAGAL